MASKRINTPAMASISYVCVGAVTKVIGILTTPLFTRMLTAEEYGSVAFYMSTVGMIAGIIAPLCSGSRLYGVISKYKSTNENIFLSIFMPLISICAVYCTLLFTFIDIFKFDILTVALVSLQIICDSTVLLYLSFLKYDYRYQTVIPIILVEAIASPLISAILIVFFDLGYLGRILGSILPSGIIALTIIIKELFNSSSRIEKEASLKAVKGYIPLLPNAIIGSAGAHADKIITAYLLGQAAIAKYSVAHSIGMGLYFVISSLSSSLTPWITRKLNSGEENRIKEVTDIIGTGLGALALFIIAFAPEAMAILAPAEYSEAAIAVAPIALSTVPAFYSATSSSIMLHKELNGELTVSKILSLTVGLAAWFGLIPKLGYLGVGLGVFLSELCGAISNCYFVKRRSQHSLFKPSGVLNCIIIPVILGAMISALTNSLAIRLLLLTVPSAILINSLIRSQWIIKERTADE